MAYLFVAQWCFIKICEKWCNSWQNTATNCTNFHKSNTELPAAFNHHFGEREAPVGNTPFTCIASALGGAHAAHQLDFNMPGRATSVLYLILTDVFVEVGTVKELTIYHRTVDHRAYWLPALIGYCRRVAVLVFRSVNAISGYLVVVFAFVAENVLIPSDYWLWRRFGEIHEDDFPDVGGGVEASNSGIHERGVFGQVALSCSVAGAQKHKETQEKEARFNGVKHK